MDTRQAPLPSASQILGLPVLNPEGVLLGTVHAIANDAVPGREPCLIVAHRDRTGGYRFSGFLAREFECRRHGLGYFLVLPVFAETLELLPGVEPSMLLRDHPEQVSRLRPVPPPAVRRAIPAVT